MYFFNFVVSEKFEVRVVTFGGRFLLSLPLSALSRMRCVLEVATMATLRSNWGWNRENSLVLRSVRCLLQSGDA